MLPIEGESNLSNNLLESGEMGGRLWKGVREGRMMLLMSLELRG